MRQLLSIKVILRLLCLVTLFLAQTSLVAAEKQTLVLLHGACSAGKTSICEKLKTQHSHWHVMDLDTVYMHEVVNLVKTTFPKEFSVIAEVVEPQNLYHAIKRNEVTLQGEPLESLTKIQQSLNGVLGKAFQTELWMRLDAHLIEQIETTFNSDKDVIMISWLSKGIIEEHFKDCRIVHVLVYTPFATSFQFFQRRNEEALQTNNLTNKRFLGQFLGSFEKHFCVTKERTSRSLSEISQADIEAIFETASSHIIQTEDTSKETIFTQNEINLSELKRIKAAFLPEQIRAQDKLFVEPKQPYDFVICPQTMDFNDLLAALKTEA